MVERLQGTRWDFRKGACCSHRGREVGPCFLRAEAERLPCHSLRWDAPDTEEPLAGPTCITLGQDLPCLHRVCSCVLAVALHAEGGPKTQPFCCGTRRGWPEGAGIWHFSTGTGLEGRSREEGRREWTLQDLYWPPGTLEGTWPPPCLRPTGSPVTLAARCPIPLSPLDPVTVAFFPPPMCALSSLIYGPCTVDCWI